MIANLIALHRFLLGWVSLAAFCLRRGMFSTLNHLIGFAFTIALGASV